MIELRWRDIEALHEHIQSGAKPIRIGIWSTEVLGKQMPGATFFYEDQRESYEKKYLIASDYTTAALVPLE